MLGILIRTCLIFQIRKDEIVLCELPVSLPCKVSPVLWCALGRVVGRAEGGASPMEGAVDAAVHWALRRDWIKSWKKNLTSC